MTGSPMTVIVEATSRKKPNQLALVLDPAAEMPVRVWWALDRERYRWRCSVHGPRRNATCPHMVAAVQPVPEPIVYLAHERPDVEVLWEGAWCRGELRMQRQDNSGQWLCNVQYRRPGELSSHIDTFRASEVRSDAKGDSILRDDPVRGAIDTTHLDSTTKIDC